MTTRAASRRSSRATSCVVNRRLDADFDPGAFDHVPRWSAADEWVDIRLRARSRQVVTIADLDLRVGLAAGEEIHTEISAKFRPDRLSAELAGCGSRSTAGGQIHGGLRRRPRVAQLAFRAYAAIHGHDTGRRRADRHRARPRRSVGRRSASGSARARATRPPEQAGVSHLIEHLLFKGSAALLGDGDRPGLRRLGRRAECRDRQEYTSSTRASWTRTSRPHWTS